MSRYRDELRQYAAATEPSPELGAGLDRHRAARARTRAQSLAAGGLLALAAAALLLRAPTAPPSVARGLTDRGAADLGDAVHVRWEGAGRADGDARALTLGWDAGALAVDVDPGRGVSLTVVTGEAIVRVVGTGFDVRRDAFGTAVSVRHGVVSVQCAGGPERRLAAGDDAECLPVTPAALLGRARAQMKRGDAPTAVLPTLEAARAGADGEVAAELGLLHAYELARADRPEEALAVADAALATASNRRVELLRLATRLATDLGGCARARPYADALAAVGEPTPCPPEPE